MIIKKIRPCSFKRCDYKPVYRFVSKGSHLLRYIVQQNTRTHALFIVLSWSEGFIVPLHKKVVLLTLTIIEVSLY